MATREGIYVGGHEIIQRYVGNRLVWEKWIYVGSFTNLISASERYSQAYFSINSSSGRFNERYRSDSLTKETMIKFRKNQHSGTLYAKFAYIYSPNTGQNNYGSDLGLYVTFKDTEQKRLFLEELRTGGDLDFYIR